MLVADCVDRRARPRTIIDPHGYSLSTSWRAA
jgi:hypothetical protein